MSWKIIILQSCIVIAGAFLAIQYFSITEISSNREIQEELTTALTMINERISTLEQDIATLQARSDLALFQKPRDKRDSSNHQSPRDTEHLRKMEQKIEHLEKQISTYSEQQDHGTAPPPQQPSAYNWLSTLQQEKQSRVKEIYHEQLTAMEEKITSSSGAYPPSSEDMLLILNENRAQLRNKLQNFLTPEEYGRFLDAQNTLPPPPLSR